MRADRLLALLMILQTRGRVTADRLAAELEVSVRTIYRDIEALSTAGVPVYADRGPGGGCTLLDSYRTTLTGLSEDEARALFMLSIPTPLAKLGVTENLRGALLKLNAALPASRMQAALRTRQRIHLDPQMWHQQEEDPLPHLQTLHQAVWEDRVVLLTYRRIFETDIQRQVEPYALVAKGTIWYLVYRLPEGDWRALRVSAIQDVQLSPHTFTRQADFDLPAFWAALVSAQESHPFVFEAVVRAAPQLMPWLAAAFRAQDRQRITAVGSADDRGWVRLTLRYESFEAARAHLLGLGGAVEVLEPLPLRLSVLDYARQVVAVYQNTAVQ